MQKLLVVPYIISSLMVTVLIGGSAADAYAKTLIGGQSDLMISAGQGPSRYNTEQMLIADENDFAQLLSDFDKLPVIVNNTILPELRQHFMEHQDTLSDDYAEDIQIVYSANENILDILVVAHPDSLGWNTESCNHKIIDLGQLSEPAELRMSQLDHFFMQIAVYSNLGSGINYLNAVDMIEDQTRQNSQILALEAQETLLEHKDEILSEGSVERIYVQKFQDIVQVSIRFPPFGFGDSYVPARDPIETVDWGREVATVPEYGSAAVIMSIAVLTIVGYTLAIRYRRGNRSVQ